MKISIITPTLNRLAFLQRTGESIFSRQGDIELEWIVADGGSTDGSAAWLADLARRDVRVHFSSQPDAGQSDAINQGLARATGDVVAWLNADDLYLPGALESVSQAFAAKPDAAWLIGRYEVIDSEDRLIRQSIVRYKERRLSRFSFQSLLRENIVPQPAVFWRRSFGECIGLLDVSLNWTMDYDFWLRMARKSSPLLLDRRLAQFRHHAESKSGVLNRRQFDEGFEVARRYANGDRLSLMAHRFNVEKIVWGYRVLRLLGR